MNQGDDRIVLLHPEQESARVTDQVGMVVFLGSWAVMFAALFGSYGLLRLRAPYWPPPGFDPLPLLLPAINTVVLLASSVTLHLGYRAFAAGQVQRFRRQLLATLFLGVIFMALQFVVWLDLWQAGLQMSTGIYHAFFYVLTFFHAAHVVVGLGLLGWLVPQVRATAGSPKRGSRIRVVGMFWHFVDVVWVLMFAFVYVL